MKESQNCQVSQNQISLQKFQLQIDQFARYDIFQSVMRIKKTVSLSCRWTLEGIEMAEICTRKPNILFDVPLEMSWIPWNRHIAALSRP